MKKILLFSFLFFSFKAQSQLKLKKIVVKNLPSAGYWDTVKIIGIPYYNVIDKVTFFKGYLVKYLPGEYEIKKDLASPSDYYLDSKKKRVDVILVDYTEIEWKN